MTTHDVGDVIHLGFIEAGSKIIERSGGLFVVHPDHPVQEITLGGLIPVERMTYRDGVLTEDVVSPDVTLSVGVVP